MVRASESFHFPSVADVSFVRIHFGPGVFLFEGFAASASVAELGIPDERMHLIGAGNLRRARFDRSDLDDSHVVRIHLTSARKCF